MFINRANLHRAMVIFCFSLLSLCTPASANFFDICKSGTPEQIADAIKHGANVNVVETEQNNYTGYTPLMIAAQYNANPDVIMELLNAGANVNAENNIGGGITPLMYAMLNRNPVVAEELIVAGANVNARDYSSGTALMDAAQNRNDLPIVIALIKAGADLNAIDINDYTALDFAALNNNSQIVTVLLNAGAESGTSIASKSLRNELFVALFGFFVVILGIVIYKIYSRQSRIPSI